MSCITDPSESNSLELNRIRLDSKTVFTLKFAVPLRYAYHAVQATEQIDCRWLAKLIKHAAAVR
ncbi:MAG: hypothetical protein DHS20C12_08920 [Pseudohongiella sp.]|nr:MAG: hypothetical protein DHS20C12_08920 [Pseudohongiella sp.]